jgi:acetyl-CoA acetyltransferase
MPEAFICDGVRTPIGRYAGALSSVRTDDLAAIPIKTLIERNPNVDWKRVDDVLLGCANQAGEDNRNVARMAALLAGVPVDVSGATVNRLCGSGMEAVVDAARAKLGLGDIDVVELNEAFAAQSLAVLRQLGLPDDADHVNPNGGAIALGHPLGMSGARLLLTAVHELANRKARYALCTMCVGVGQGVASILERV